VAATVLVDGFVGGTWQSSLAKGRATLTVSLFSTVDRRTRLMLEEEGDRLLRFIEPSAQHFAIEIK
jgi:hypothetical protein